MPCQGQVIRCVRPVPRRAHDWTGRGTDVVLVPTKSGWGLARVRCTRARDPDPDGWLHERAAGRRPAGSLRGAMELRRSERQPCAWDVSRDWCHAAKQQTAESRNVIGFI